MSAEHIVIAKETFHVGRRTVEDGTRLSSSDPIVKGRESLFEPVDGAAEASAERLAEADKVRDEALERVVELSEQVAEAEKERDVALERVGELEAQVAELTEQVAAGDKEPDAPVEQATAAPGEKRDTKRKGK